MKNLFFGWNNIREVLRDIYATFSNEKSYLSSKRIERAILFNTAMVLICVFVWHKRNDLSAAEFLMIVSPLFVYAGFNTIVAASAKKDEKVAAQTDVIIKDKIPDKPVE